MPNASGSGRLMLRNSVIALIVWICFCAPLAADVKEAREADVRGLRLILQKDWDHALAHYREAVERFPDFAPLWRNLASLHELRGESAPAVAALCRAAALDPGQVKTWMVLRDLMLKTGREREWLCLAASWWTGTRSPEAFKAWAGALVRLGRWSQAEKLMDKRPPGVSDFRLSFPTASAADASRRLVLLITLDTFRQDAVDPAVTPNLAALESVSHVFTEAVSVAPITFPAHASMMTGLYPNHHGVRDNSIYRLSPQAVTAADLFKARGWSTAAFVSAFILDHRFGLDKGFDRYGDVFSRTEKQHRFPESRRAGETLAEAAGYLRASKDSALFVWLHLYDAHAPYDPPFPFNEAWPDRPYRGETAYLDYALGKWFGSLKDSGLWDRTSLLVIGDHGESLGEHGEATHGFLLYRSTLRVPLVVHLPGQERMVRHDGPVSTVDVFPTLAGWIHAAAPAVDGRSLFDAPRERLLYSETQIPLPFHWSDLYRVQKGNLACVAEPRGKAFDAKADPGERKPLERIPGELAQAVEAYKADRRGLKSVENPLDDEALERLKSLGYAHAGGLPSAGRHGNLPDPETKMASLLYYQRALAAEDDGDLKALEKWTRALLDGEKDNPSMLAFGAEWLHKAGRDRDAADAVRRALVLDPAHPQALFYSGLMAERAGRLEEAESAYHAALKAQPGLFFARYNLSRVYLMEKKWDAAQAAMGEILKGIPNHAYTLNNMAYLYWARDRNCEKALEYVRRADAAKPDDPAIRESLKSTLHNCGKDADRRP
jgi:choline-sulfatase